MHTILWLENLKGRNHLEDLSVDGRIILELGGCRLDLSGSGWKPVADPRERGNEPWGSIKGVEFLD